MSPVQTEADRIYELTEPWIVLAVGVFITACCTQNFSAIQLLKAPVRFEGKINNGVATIDLPNWFPAQEPIFEFNAGAIYSKLKDLPLAVSTR
ncbi:MAG: hypothetical protein ACREEP_14570, partial [Dongiaceae bacterium]